MINLTTKGDWPLDKLNSDIVADLVVAMIADADSALRDLNENQTDFNNARLLQAKRTISTLQTYLLPFGLDNFGLDFDADRRYRYKGRKSKTA